MKFFFTKPTISFHKILLLLFSIIISCNLSVSSAFAINWTQDANCQAAWLFTEGSGTSVADDSQNSNSGSFKGSGEPAWAAMAGTNAPSYADYSVDFDGTNDYILVTDNNTLSSSGDLSVLAWAYAEALDDSQYTHQIIAKDNDGTNTREYGLFLYANGANWNVAASVFKSGNTESNQRGSDVNISTSEWMHCGFTYDYVGDGNSILVVYHNGVAVGTKTNAVGPIQNTATDLRIGMRQYPGYEGYFDGDISEGGVFDTLFDATDINDIMDNGLVQAAAGRTRRFF